MCTEPYDTNVPRFLYLKWPRVASSCPLPLPGRAYKFVHLKYILLSYLCYCELSGQLNSSLLPVVINLHVSVFFSYYFKYFHLFSSFVQYLTDKSLSASTLLNVKFWIQSVMSRRELFNFQTAFNKVLLTIISLNCV